MVGEGSSRGMYIYVSCIMARQPLAFRTSRKMRLSVGVRHVVRRLPNDKHDFVSRDFCVQANPNAQR